MEIQYTAMFISICSTFISLCTLFFLVFQLRQHKIFKKAELENSLDDELFKYKEIISRFYPGGKYFNNQTKIPDSEFTDLGFLISYYEKLKHLLDTDLINLEAIDKLFGYRFFVFTNNTTIQNDLFSEKYKDSFDSIFALHKQWSIFRKNKNKKIPYSDTSLEKINPKLYNQYVNRYYTSK